ncbi:MAG: HIG1 domain-containing protein [Thiotrichales bacterium]|nr:MAG: HIG1 domain-containing protein [Thiotrichales bacterium]
MSLLTLLVVLSLVGVVAALIWGVGSMAHGGSYDREHSEQIMFTRIAIQAVAFILIVVAVIYAIV